MFEKLLCRHEWKFLAKWQMHTLCDCDCGCGKYTKIHYCVELTCQKCNKIKALKSPKILREMSDDMYAPIGCYAQREYLIERRKLNQKIHKKYGITID